MERIKKGIDKKFERSRLRSTKSTTEQIFTLSNILSRQMSGKRVCMPTLEERKSLRGQRNLVGHGQEAKH